jgi:DNA-binding NarL/FixJ family response regulator
MKPATAGRRSEKSGGIPPDPAMIDIGMPDGNRIEAARQVRRRFPGVFIPTLRTTPEQDSAVPGTGVSGFALKQTSPAEAVYQEGSFSNPSIRKTVIRGFKKRRTSTSIYRMHRMLPGFSKY